MKNRADILYRVLERNQELFNIVQEMQENKDYLDLLEKQIEGHRHTKPKTIIYF